LQYFFVSNPDLYSTFEALFREHYSTLANYAFSLLKNREDAEDVVQDVFVKLWQNSPAVVTTPQVKFYLFTSTKNSCISLLRKQSGKYFVPANEVSLSGAAHDEPPEEGTDLLSIAEKAISALPPQCQVIFRMSRLGKMTYQEIADEMGISVKTVENQVGKALRMMREYAKKNNISFSLLLLVGVLQNSAFSH
jgi:RNA polymerase sigma-70 factor (family 1)